MTLVHIRARVALACIGAALAGCGGGADAPSPARAPAQQSAEEQANAGVAAYLSYVRRQISEGTSDTVEARNIDALRPPVSEADEPAAI